MEVKNRTIEKETTDIGYGSHIDYYAEAWSLSKNGWDTLMSLRPEKRGVLFGHTVPRDLQTFGKPYKFSGVNHPSKSMPLYIKRLMRRASMLTGVDFNMALVNWYMDGNDSISPHADDEDEIKLDKDGNSYPVACFSFGVTRKFLIKPKEKGTKSVPFHLENGSLVVMGGKCQKTHLHSIPKTKKLEEHPDYGTVRISVTFRRFK